MQQSLKSVVAGIASGAATYFASTYTIGYTSAIAMPSGVSIALWQAVVIFGVGALLVAFVVHFVALRALSARGFLAFVAFGVTAAIAFAIAGLFATGGKALVAWLLGSLLASVAARRLRPNNSFKPKPLRGSA